LRKLFSSKETSIKGWTMHNAQFDMNQVRAEFGVRFPYEKIIRDTMLMMHLMDENRINRSNENFKLKDLVKEFIGFIDYDKEAMEARTNGVIMELPTKKLINYAGNDTVCTFRLERVIELWAKIENYHTQLMMMTNYLHNPALRLYAEMRVNGFGIDMQRLAELLAPNSVIRRRLIEIEQSYRTFPEIKKVNDEIYMRQVGKKKLFKVPYIFDMNKPKFRSELFFFSEHGFKYPPNESKKYSTNKKFQEIYAPTNPIVELFQESQGLSQLKKMYIQPIYEAMRSGKGGDVSDLRVHPNFNLAGTVTGRLSSNNPNCIAEGSMVTTTHDGDVEIENIKVGDWVECIDDCGIRHSRRVLNKWDRGEQECLSITVDGSRYGGITVTRDHKITEKNTLTYTKAEDLCVGDELISIDGKPAIVRSAFSVGKQRVWDIEVEEFHNFFADGVNTKNCQQIPRSDTPTKKAIKALFCAPPGRALMQADFAAAEVRMWGAMSKDKYLCELLQQSFRKRGEYRKNPDDEKLKIAAELMGDVHKQTASLMFGVDLYAVDWGDKKFKDMRQTTKSITFGLMYGRGTKSVSQQINKTDEETEELKGKFFARFSDGEKWLSNQKVLIKKNGYVQTPLGRRRRCPQVFSGDKQMVKQAERFAVNAPIQATASDYAMLATAMLQKYFIENDLTDKYKIVNAVHDSVVIEFPANVEDMKYLARLIRKIYTEQVRDVLKRDFDFELLAPMDIDIEVSYNKYKKCKKCGATLMMHETECHNKVSTGEKDAYGKDEKKACRSKEFSVEKLRYHAYGYLTELVETKQGFANAALGL